MDPGSRLELLGGFRLSHHGDPVSVSPSGQRLLAVLAICYRSRRASRVALAERLWPDSPGARASSNLRSVLWRLPRPRGRALVQSSSTTACLSEGLEVDLWRAEQMVHDVCGHEPVSCSDSDLALLRLDLLPDWCEDWLDLEQESYRQKRLHALERSAGALCEEGRFTDALVAGLDAVRSEPLRESAHRRVIEVHLAEGNHAAALRQYDSYRRLLAREIGLRPSDTIRRLVAPLLADSRDVSIRGV
jgi:DNA-binding SARP family transcriptional activator